MKPLEVTRESEERPLECANKLNCVSRVKAIAKALLVKHSSEDTIKRKEALDLGLSVEIQQLVRRPGEMLRAESNCSQLMRGGESK